MAQTRKTSSTKKSGSASKPKTTKPTKAKATTTTKSVKTTKNTKTTKNAKATSTDTSGKVCKIILGIMIGVLAVACIVFAVCKIATSGKNGGSDNALTLENGAGDKIDAVYASIDGYNYRALVPASFKALDDATIKEIYGEEDAPTLVYSNDKHTVNVAFSKPEIELSNDDLSDYLDAMKRIFDLSADILNTNLYTIKDHNIANLEMVTNYTDDKLYNNMAFFSYDNKLAIIAFNCKENESGDWKKVGQEIIESIEFTE